jgi:hypothetical protein
MAVVSDSYASGEKKEIRLTMDQNATGIALLVNFYQDLKTRKGSG